MTKKKKKQSKANTRFWKIAISAIGIALILIEIGNLFLFIFRETTQATVTTRQFGGTDDSFPVYKRYEWSVDYTFIDEEENTHRSSCSIAIIISERRK